MPKRDMEDMSESGLLFDLASKTAAVRKLSTDLHLARSDLHDAMLVYEATFGDAIEESEHIARDTRAARAERLERRKRPKALNDIATPPVVATTLSSSSSTSTEAKATTPSTSPNTKAMS